MSAFKRKGQWVAKFQLRGEQIWVPGGPWATRRQALEAERRHRDRLEARRTNETCASFAERWLIEWPRPQASTRQLYAQAARRFAAEFGATPLGEVERLSARTWALGVPRNLSKIIGTMYEDARNVGIVESNPFSNLRLPATEKTEEVQPPTMDEYRRLLEACLALGGYGAEFRAAVRSRLGREFVPANSMRFSGTTSTATTCGSGALAKQTARSVRRRTAVNAGS